MKETRKVTFLGTSMVKRDSCSNRVKRPCLAKKKEFSDFHLGGCNICSSRLSINLPKNITGDIAERGSRV
jgi:hypothetical protein